MKNITKNLDAAEQPKGKCNDVKCPFHGKLALRGKTLTGTIISTKMRKTSVVEFERTIFLPKYERYEKRRTKLKVHYPECLDVKEGDIVIIMECRPLSKTKNFVIVQKAGHEKGFKGRMEARESAKAIDREKEALKEQPENP